MDKDNAWEGFYAEGYENGYQAGMEEKKPWVNLTDEEMFEALKSVDVETIRLPFAFKQFIQAAEAKLREKNGG
jgi:hypothetical protein